VLVVEDDHISRKLLRIYIEDLGCRVIEASDGLAAFEICLSTGAPIELIVTDQILPGMTGLKLIESLRQKNPGLPAILMSGHTRDELDLPDSVRFIAKPLASEVLESMVRGILFEAPPSK
jgi:CheY-like chemotaxis protein